MERYLIARTGGKRLLRKTIAPLIPENIKQYIEPFGGGAWMLFYKDKWAQNEIYNDIDGDLVNLFRIAKYHPNALSEELKYALNSREMFYEYYDSKPVTDIQRAARYFLVIYLSFGAKGGRSFGVRSKYPDTGTGHKSIDITERLDFVRQRLKYVVIENRDYKDIIDYYDNKEAFFYLDPPYTKGCKYEITNDFKDEELFLKLKNLKGRFLLSYNECEKIRNLYKDYYIKPVERLNGIYGAKDKNKMYKELLIANYPF